MVWFCGRNVNRRTGQKGNGMKGFKEAQREYDNRQPPEYWDDDDGEYIDDEDDEDEGE